MAMARFQPMSSRPPAVRGDWETESVGPTGGVAGPDGGDVGWGTDSVVVAAGGGDGATSTGAFCSTSDWVK